MNQNRWRWPAVQDLDQFSPSSVHPRAIHDSWHILPYQTYVPLPCQAPTSNGAEENEVHHQGVQHVLYGLTLVMKSLASP